jgi:hypothetical protein
VIQPWPRVATQSSILTLVTIGLTLKGTLRRRAYTVERFREMAEAPGSTGCEMSRESIGFTAWLGSLS